MSQSEADGAAASPVQGVAAAGNDVAPNGPAVSGVPTFDVVRVEPDGSVVVAGRAAAGANVEMVESGKVLGSAVAGGEGDFAIVLDEPLRAGEHQIQLSGTMADGSTETSEQTALISVPAENSGQVLAMVEEPNRPSRLLTVPQADPASPKADTAGPVAASQDDPRSEPSLGGSKQNNEKPFAAGNPVAEAANDSDIPARGGQTSTERKQASLAAGNGGTAAASVSVQAVEIEGRKIYVAGLAPPGTTVRVYADHILLGDAKTGAGGQFLVETQRDLPVGNYTVRADVLNARGTVVARAAVPFEREKGETVAAVAPELEIPLDASAGGGKNGPGAGSTTEDGSALADQPATTDQGTTTSPKADASSTATSEDSTRTESTAVAPHGGKAAPTGTASTPSIPDAATATARSTVDGSPVESTDTLSKPLRTDGDTEQAFAAKSSGSDARSATTSPDPAMPQVGTTAEATAKPDTSALTRSSPQQDSPRPGLSDTPALTGSTTDTLSELPAMAAAPEPKSSRTLSDANGTALVTEPSATAPGPGNSSATVDTTGGPAPSQGVADATGEPAVGLAPQLRNVDAAVIIRRGDSLWRISRRVYGLGTRYATIYLANSDQIRNPDLILPGQVFAVPARSQQGESADLNAMGEQITTKSGDTSEALEAVR